jgi:hypothetical protein
LELVPAAALAETFFRCPNQTFQSTSFSDPTWFC